MAPRNSFSVNPSRKENREMRDLTAALRKERRKVEELERENEEKKKNIFWLQTELAEWKSKYIHSVSSNGELVVVCGKYDEERKIFENKYKEAKEELERMREERNSPKEENEKRIESLLISLGSDVRIMAELLRNASEKMISVQETIQEINQDKQRELGQSKFAVPFCAVLFLGKLKARATRRKMEAEEKSAMLRKKFSNLLKAGLFVTKLKMNWERMKIEREKERMTIEMRAEHRRTMALEDPEEKEERNVEKEKAATVIHHFLRRFVEKKRMEEMKEKREFCYQQHIMKYKRRMAEKKKMKKEECSLKKEEGNINRTILKEELQKLIEERQTKKLGEKEFAEKKREIYDQIKNLLGSWEKTLPEE